MPPGWEARALAGRIIAARACTYTDLVSGRISMEEFFEVLRVLDWNDRLADRGRERREPGRDEDG